MHGDWIWQTGPHRIPRQIQPLPKSSAPQATSPARTFQAAFQKELEKQRQSRSEPLSFSAHALERLRQRNVQLSEGDVRVLASAVDTIATKGGKESLILYRDTAFLVSVDNRKVITAMGKDQMRDHVFTNIDSAMVL
jgi:flagellar operon protein